jgi:hypothetical protein
MATDSYFLHDVKRCKILYDLLRPYSNLNVLDPAEFSAGAVSRYLGMAASLMRRWDEAAAHYEAALKMNERMRARPWLARTQHDHARMLLARDRPGDREQAIQLLLKARETCSALGMALETTVSSLLAQLDVHAEGVPTPAGIAEVTAAHPTVFRREGEYWSVAYGGESFRLRDSKGLRHIAHLIASPAESFIRSTSLLPPNTPPPGTPARSNITAWNRRPATRGRFSTLLPGDTRRLEELREDLDEAENWGDPERAARAQAELDFLARELSSTVGLGGRGRRAASPAERARQSVTKAISAAVARIAKENPSLGRHLSSTIHTGNFCRYEPDPRSSITWIL